MKKLIVVCIIALFIVSSKAYAVPELKLPFQGGETWSITTGYGGSDYHSGKDYYAIDFNLSGSSDLGKPILAVANGSVLFADWIDGYGWVVKLNHGEGYVSLYAHLNEKPVVTGQILQGTVIGYCGMSGGTSTGPHLHFAMYYNGNAYKPEPMSGYTKFTPGRSYTSDNYFTLAHYSNNTLSQPILTRYTISTTQGHPLGSPRDNNGGGVYVHNWNGVILQDFHGDNTGYYHGNTSIMLNPAGSSAHLLKEGFWDCYMNNNGSVEFGSPFTEEIIAKYTNSPFVLTNDYVQPDNEIVVQKFQQVNSTQRRTLVYNKTRGGSVQNFAVGEFSIGSDRSENNVQWYVTKDSNPNNDIPWPKAGVLTPTGRWFTKAISGEQRYNFVRHDAYGYRMWGKGFTVAITEGNSQYAEPNNPIQPTPTPTPTLGSSQASNPWMDCQGSGVWGAVTNISDVGNWVKLGECG